MASSVPLEPNAHGDLFIPPDDTGDAMTGDIVVAKVNRKGRRGAEARYTGEIITVMERANNRFVGTLMRHPEAWLVQPDGTSFIEPIVVEDITAKNAREKDKVVVEILSYPSENVPGARRDHRGARPVRAVRRGDPVGRSTSTICRASSKPSAWSRRGPPPRSFTGEPLRAARTSPAR